MRKLRRFLKAVFLVAVFLFLVLPSILYTGATQFALAQAGDPSSSAPDVGPVDPGEIDPNSFPSGLEVDPNTMKPDTNTKNDIGNSNPFNPAIIPEYEDEKSEGSFWDYMPWNVGSTVGKKVSGWVWNAINNALLKTARGALRSIISQVYSVMFQDINFMDANNEIVPIYRHMAWIVGGVFCLIIILVALKTIIGSAFNWSNYRVKLLLPRIFLAAFCAIFALPICQVFVSASHSASMSILNFFEPQDNALALVAQGLSPVATPIPTLVLLLVILMVIGFACLAMFYIVRRVALVFLAVVAPLAFVLWIDDSTSQYTTLWAKAFMSLCFVEVVHALMTLILFNLLFRKGDVMASVLYCFAALYLFWKIPAIIFESTVIHWGPRPAQSIGYGAAAVRGVGGLVPGAV